MKISKRGFIGSAIIHLIILAILLFFGFSYPHPPPEEMGVLVNFGTSETGLGKTEPAGDKVQAQAEETVPEIKPKQTEKITERSKTDQAEKKLVQNTEEAPVKVKTPSAEELRQKEIERIRQEELRKQREEEENKRKMAEKWSSTGQSVFGNKGVGTTSGSEGITQGDGNQGDPNGLPGVDNYGAGGGLGSGISFGLDNRIGRIPAPVDNCIVTSRVIIKVQINVDREGNVVGTPKVIESNFQDPCIYESVISAAAKAKFNADPKAAYRQQGWIRYTYEP